MARIRIGGVGALRRRTVPLGAAKIQGMQQGLPSDTGGDTGGASVSSQSSRSSQSSQSSQSESKANKELNPYKYLKVQANRFRIKDGKRIRVGMTSENAAKTVRSAYPNLMNDDDKQFLLDVVSDERTYEEDRAMLVFIYMMCGALFKLSEKWYQNVQKEKSKRLRDKPFPQSKYANLVPNTDDNWQLDNEKIKNLMLIFTPDKVLSSSNIDLFERNIPDGFTVGQFIGICKEYMDRIKPAVRITSSTLHTPFYKAYDDYTREDEGSQYAKFDVIRFALLQLVKDELAGSSNIKGSKVEEVYNKGTEVDRDYLSAVRKAEESHVKVPIVEDIKKAQYNIRLGERARRRKIKAGQQQSIDNKQEALGRSLSGVGAKYIFPAPAVPNTSTREGQTCIANVDRDSGLVLAQFKELKVVIPKGVLLGFTANSGPGQYLIYEYAEDLDGFRRSITVAEYEKAKTAALKRKDEYEQWKSEPGNKLKSAEIFAQGFYENRYEKYRRSVKAYDRKKQTFKRDVNVVMSKRGEFATTQVKSGKKSAKKRVAMEMPGEDMPDDQNDFLGGTGADGGGNVPQAQPEQPPAAEPRGKKRKKADTDYKKRKGPKKTQEQVEKGLLSSRFTKQELADALEAGGIKHNYSNPTKQQLVDVYYDHRHSLPPPPPPRKKQRK